MKQAAQLQAIIELLSSIDTTERPAEKLAHDYFRSRRFIGSHDRRFIMETIYKILKNQSLLNWWTIKQGYPAEGQAPLQAARMRLLCYLWLVEKSEILKINSLFNGDTYAPPPLSKSERRLIQETLKDEPLPPWVEGDFPEWLYPSLKRIFKDNLIPEMRAFQTQASVDLRVNLLKNTRQEAQQILEREGISTIERPYSATALRCSEKSLITSSKAFQQGLVEIQDEASQCAAHLLQAKPGQCLLDFCAGAGGKSLAIAANMDNKGRLIATDIADWRLKRSKERLKRAGIHNTELRLITSPHDKWLKKQKNRFDGILIDAPCSGTGTWRRHPEQKWRLKPKDLKELNHIQLELLEAASPLVKEGGRIVYATCSILCEENEDIIHGFLVNHPDYTLLPISSDNSYLRMTPFQHETDGFFAAIMVKNRNNINGREQ